MFASRARSHPDTETFRKDDLSEEGQPPAITALLPREKTYNVAAITDRTTSLGAGVVTQVAAVGGSFLSGRKTYYIVKDQDTVALTFQPTIASGERQRPGFAWQFRPVLGEDFVQAGLKQTFVQLTFPSPESTPSFGKVHIRTYWRKYDRDHGVLKGIVPGSLKECCAEKLKGVMPGSLRECYPESDIPSFPMAQDISAMSVQDLEDLGNGQMFRFLSRICGLCRAEVDRQVCDTGQLRSLGRCESRTLFS